MEVDEHGIVFLFPNLECSVTGHQDAVTKVAFSNDGAQVISASNDCSVRFWDIASGRQVRLLAGEEFKLVEGLSDQRKRGRYVLTRFGHTLRIYEVAKERQHLEDGAAEAPVAFFIAPQQIVVVRCHGAKICVMCDGGAVCFLSAPFLTA